MTLLCHILLLVNLLSLTPAEVEQQHTYHLYAATEAWEQKRYDDTWALADLCLQLQPGDPTAHHLMGLLCEGTSRNEAALQHYSAAYQAAPKHYWKRYCYLGYTTGNAAQRKEAIRSLRTTAEDLRDNGEAWEMLTDMYRNEGDWKNALLAVRQLEKAQGPSVYTVIEQHDMLMQLGKKKQADKLIESWLRDEPDDPIGWMYLCERELRDQHWEKALAGYQDIINRFPGYDKATEQLFKTHVLWGDHLLLKKHKAEKAYEQYEAALAIVPGVNYVLNNYAWALATNKGDLKKAERMSAETIRTEPNSPTYLDTYAWILHLQGQDQLAAFFIRKALEEAVKAGYPTREIEQHKQKIEGKLY